MTLDHIWQHLFSPLHTSLTWADWYDYYNSTLIEGQVLKTDDIIYGALPTRLIDSDVTLTEFLSVLSPNYSKMHYIVWKPRCEKVNKMGK